MAPGAAALLCTLMAPGRGPCYYCREGNSISMLGNCTVAKTGRPATRQVEAVQRAIAILDELAAARAELGTNEIARRTGINVSTISRILATLVGGGLVEHVAATGRYRLGLGVVRLASAVHERLDIRVLVRPHLAELVDLTRETA